MLQDRWIIDRVPTERFPDYTRGNAAEVLAEPVSPLGWTFCCEPGMVKGCVDGFEQMGVFDPLEYGDPPESFGLFGGYFYNSLTQARLFGVRSGGGWEQVDRTYFDPSSQEIPPYVERDWHASPRHTEKLGLTVAWCLSTPNVPEIELQKHEAKALRDSRPDLSSCTDVQLLARARVIQRHLRAFFSQVVWAALGGSVGPAILSTLVGEIDPGATAKLMSGIGDVDSADIANQIFKLSRQVRDSKELSAEFDAGLDGLLERVAASGSADAERFTSAVDDFMYVHGSRGPNEWDPYSWSYESNPILLLQGINIARTASDDADPARMLAAAKAERERLIEHFSALFADNPEAQGTFLAAVASTAVFMAARERCKTNNIRAVGEVRECFLELGRRAVANGHLEHERQIFMLVADEVDDWMADPASFTETLAEREQDYFALFELEPPYCVVGTVPPLSEWPRRDSLSSEMVKVGDELHGVAGSPGKITGTARVLLDLCEMDKLEPGDVIVAPATDPSWTPLFLAAGAVITNIGAVGTHAVIVSRELGIPCVPSIADATKRIPDGATVTVDGSLGIVTIDALP
ncbi:MAG TPA: PEP-utilizing enzyme [Acidimicrobiales bacterium]|nr:PEP-utilizing enzyme [Acidimicrobiales bacterium]